MTRLALACTALLVLLFAPISYATSFVVDVAPKTLDSPVNGRLFVFIVGPNRPLHRGESPGGWDFCAEPMPVYATSVKQLKAGDKLVIDEMADWYLARLNELKPGKYSAMAVLDWHDEASGWDMEPGNLSSKVVTFKVDERSSEPIKLTLSEVVNGPSIDPKRVEIVDIKSKALSNFHGREIHLRAGVVKPINFDEGKPYAAIYEVPGFGGRHFDAQREAERRAGMTKGKQSVAKSLAEKTFYIVLDPESPNGHTLFADSDVNGPYGKALTQELIPELEHRYPLVADAKHRIITGHSSGGWATCWLQMQYPDLFGAAWPSSPDPVDFRRFELVDIYDGRSFYERDGKDIPSTRDQKDNVTITVRQEASREEIFTKDNASGQQWDSWQAVWGSNAGHFRPKSLWDPISGEIDRFEAEHYKKYDLSLLLRNDPARYAPIWRERMHLVVGGMDDYYLNEAVAMLRDELAKLPPTGDEKTNNGYIKIVPGKGHGSIYESAEMKHFDDEMLEFLSQP